MKNNLIVKVGCCGFPKARKKYYNDFKLVELQKTFYNLPSIAWAEKIREEAPTDFEFTMKAWQVITHPKRSPTWKKLKHKPPGDIDKYGFLKPTKENLDALEKCVEIAKALKSRIIVLQTPPSMPFNQEMLIQVDRFFDAAKNIADHVLLGWEPRGEWAKHDDELRRILVKHGVIHIVDIFRREPVWYDDIVYIRLHGIGSRETNYRYKYTDEDLYKLLEKIKTFQTNEVYVLFNNIYMYDDALRFKQLLATNNIGVV